MIKTFTAFTHEVDDVEAAVAQVLAGLDLGGRNRLLGNTIGVVTCYAEYLESGVYAALAEALPFRLVGVTTIGGALRGQMGETMLSIMVMTSDDVSFSVALSDPIPGEEAAPLEAMYMAATQGLSAKPAMMLSFCPLLSNFGSDFYLEVMDGLSGGLPNFGCLTVDHNADYHQAHVLLDGQFYRDRFVLVLLAGPVTPTFYVGAISDEKTFPEKGVVTAAAGNQLRTVNGMPVPDYLQSLGLEKNADGTITGINSFPIIVDYNDGTEPVARAMFALTPEGYAVCGGDIPEGATLSVGNFDPQEIVATTRRTLYRAVEGDHGALLLFSCVGRYFAQGYDSTSEMQAVRDILDPCAMPYMMAYSGGELCPVYSRAGQSFNRNHNNSLVILAL